VNPQIFRDEPPDIRRSTILSSITAHDVYGMYFWTNKPGPKNKTPFLCPKGQVLSAAD